ncbi:hypothetical protein BN871_CR_00130 [Paenibacillus sp. P22]|nr:hypothetical protein BN871_CR_00130 [Paenibacillus sp. P22]
MTAHPPAAETEDRPLLIAGPIRIVRLHPERPCPIIDIRYP